VNFILGSGITGLLAKSILGENWQLIPFGRSRFYSFNPPTADNFIVAHDSIDPIIREFTAIPKTDRLFRASSYGGQLLFADASFAKDAYISKLFGDNIHPAAKMLLRLELNVYKHVTATEIYSSLQTRYKLEIDKARQQYGTVSKISYQDHTIQTSTGTYEYNKIISTIPLDALLDFIGETHSLPAVDVWYYHIATPALNFEGAQQVFVADTAFDFFKVDRVSGDQYVFHCRCDLGNPMSYLGAFTNSRLDVINATNMQKAFPVGTPPKLNDLEKVGIYPVGQHGQWDYFMDVGASIRRLLKLRSI
jgi:hypothetical protein